MNINKIFSHFLNLPVRSVKLGYGSFITLGFGKDLQVECLLRGKKEITIRPEWYLWIYMCDWQIELDGEILISSYSDRKIISDKLTILEGKKLRSALVLSDHYDMTLEFEANIILSLFANNLETDNVQWMLYTPNGAVLTAGPFRDISLSKE